VTLTVHCHQHGFQPPGLYGGLPGAPGNVRLDGEALSLGDARRKLGVLSLGDPGTRVTIETPGGGGIGAPRERDPEHVLADVRNGLVSVEAARRDYGVVVDLERLTAHRQEGDPHPDG
jgi:N-methylhydantoinase B